MSDLTNTELADWLDTEAMAAAAQGVSAREHGYPDRAVELAAAHRRLRLAAERIRLIGGC